MKIKKLKAFALIVTVVLFFAAIVTACNGFAWMTFGFMVGACWSVNMCVKMGDWLYYEKDKHPFL